MDTVAESHYKAYEEYSKTLRTWFVAYGIGAPVLFLNSDQLRVAVIGSGQAQSIGVLFLVGVAMQVVLAALNKAVMWCCYADAECRNATAPGPAPDSGRFMKLTWKVSSQFWIDLVVDMMSAGAFVWGTAKLFGVLSATAL